MVHHTSIRRISIQTAFGLALSACLASLAPAQSYYGGLRGTVVDPNGGAIANARVKIADQGTGAVRTTLSGTEGAFRLFGSGSRHLHSRGGISRL